MFLLKVLSRLLPKGWHFLIVWSGNKFLPKATQLGLGQPNCFKNYCYRVKLYVDKNQRLIKVHNRYPWLMVNVYEKSNIKK